MKRFVRVFSVIERIAILITMIAAFLTIVQYLLETEDRAANSRATTLNTYLACQNLLRFAIYQEEDVIHQLLLSTVELTDAAPFCAEVQGDLYDSLEEARARADEADEEAWRRVLSGDKSYFQSGPLWLLPPHANDNDQPPDDDAAKGSVEAQQ
tara:strand:- start:14154 stop:14615 length:462 start_codon:yes stop_codon:yes gene_type:complete